MIGEKSGAELSLVVINQRPKVVDVNSEPSGTPWWMAEPRVIKRRVSATNPKFTVICCSPPNAEELANRLAQRSLRAAIAGDQSKIMDLWRSAHDESDENPLNSMAVRKLQELLIKDEGIR